MKELHSALETAGVSVRMQPPLPPAEVWSIPKDGWGQAAQIAKSRQWRWSAGWGEELGASFRINALLARTGQYLLLRTEVPKDAPTLPSQAPYYPAADRPERHTRDLLGIAFEGGDDRRWIRHQAWEESAFPLRAGFPLGGFPLPQTPPDADYPFAQAHGAGVYEIPVGPVHAGIIEPGHFRFQAVGETVLRLEERLGYVHKGIEKLAVGRPMAALARLAGRVSGDTTVGHAWAACLAMERALGMEAPARAAYLRAVCAERERIANHLWDMAAILNDIAFTFGYYQFGRLREEVLRTNRALFGHRLLMDAVVPGGVAVDLDAQGISRLRREIARLRRELDELLPIVDRNASVGDRLYGTGRLSVEDAADLGCVGYVGLASGQDLDVRRDCPYPPYDRLKVRVPVEEGCDVGARFWVRYKELRIALRLLETLLERLPDGPVRVALPVPEEGAEGLGIVEGWRGEIVAYVRFGAEGQIARFFPRDPSWLNWPALERLILDNIVPDFPVCNKSVNGSYSGVDL
ncbi:NADH-quinone oxidoreductase subunit C [Methylothermus subterraneus]